MLQQAKNYQANQLLKLLYCPVVNLFDFEFEFIYIP
jgi:hypothetical protein